MIKKYLILYFGVLCRS